MKEISKNDMEIYQSSFGVKPIRCIKRSSTLLEIKNKGQLGAVKIKKGCKKGCKKNNPPLPKRQRVISTKLICSLLLDQLFSDLALYSLNHY